MFTVIFSIARSSGWAAHWHEMIEDPVQKIGRPRQLYSGNKKSVYGKKRSSKNTR
jgi:citrate synthase